MYIHNRLQTHIDPYNGEIITTDGKPPVNAKLTNFKLYGKTVQNGTPTPENPVQIQGVPSNFDVISCGKNLFDASKITGSQCTVEENGRVIKVKGYAVSSGYYFRFLPNTTYRISYKGFLSAGASAGGYGSISAFHGGTTVFSLTSGQLSGDINRTFTTPSQIPNDGLLALYFYGPSNSGGNEYGYIYEDLVLTYEGVADRAWESYVGTTTPVTVNDTNGAPHELCSLSDGTRDEVDLDGGESVDRVGIKIFDGSEAFVKRDVFSGNGYACFQWQIWDSSFHFAPNVGICDRFALTTTTGTKTQSCFRIANFLSSDYESIIQFWVPESTASTASEFKTWLANNNTKVLYKRENPIPWTLHPDEIAKLKQIKSVYPSTNIFTSASTQPTLACNIRKLGNRPFIEHILTDESGNFLVDENGNNIGGLY